jgi:hypothetical protein
MAAGNNEVLASIKGGFIGPIEFHRRTAFRVIVATVNSDATLGWTRPA